MKYILLSILMASSTLSAKNEISRLPDILFTSSYTATSSATDEQREDRAHVGYCLHVLYLQTDYIDKKVLGVDYNIQLAAKDVLPKNATEKEVTQVIKISCKKALDKKEELKPGHFRDALFAAIEKYKP